ncbi:myosin-2 essential light chain-like [Octopus vulgaris]|uniref:Myosin-2 essential light chain-like n=2 Tax=Octopus TaxID=6643 RepID=A0AA36F859_OCTVU|nr:myosin-2 essential light chain isoform X2 [Octopus sinensis]CAI9727834.1 myosin-2 essential light chain-like [Octopus vulgaris]
MSQLTEERIGDLLDIFNLFDEKGDGKISAHQLGEVLRAMGENPTQAEVKKCGYEVERISFETVLPILQTINRNKDPVTFEDLVEGFKVFDKDQNGFVSSAEMRHLLSGLGERLTSEEADQLLQGVEDSHGNVNYEELIRMVLAG